MPSHVGNVTFRVGNVTASARNVPFRVRNVTSSARNVASRIRNVTASDTLTGKILTKP